MNATQKSASELQDAKADLKRAKDELQAMLAKQKGQQSALKALKAMVKGLPKPAKGGELPSDDAKKIKDVASKLKSIKATDFDFDLAKMLGKASEMKVTTPKDAEAFGKAMTNMVSEIEENSLSEYDLEDWYNEVEAAEERLAEAEYAEEEGGKQASLRSKVIRLAHAKPELRPHLLPLLKR